MKKRPQKKAKKKIPLSLYTKKLSYILPKKLFNQILDRYLTSGKRIKYRGYYCRACGSKVPLTSEKMSLDLEEETFGEMFTVLDCMLSENVGEKDIKKINKNYKEAKKYLEDYIRLLFLRTI